MLRFICYLRHRDSRWERLTLAQEHHPSNSYRPWSPYQLSAKTIGIIIGAVLGAILLVFLLLYAPVFYAKVVDRRRGVSQERVEERRTDEEFAITPLAAPSPTLATAPPPYEDPPLFEDATKRREMARGSQQGEGRDGRSGVAG